MGTVLIDSSAHKNNAPVPRHWGVSAVENSESMRTVPVDSNQKSALPVVRGKGITSLMLLTPVRYMMSRSKPRPKPACFVPP